MVLFILGVLWPSFGYRRLSRENGVDRSLSELWGPQKAHKHKELFAFFRVLEFLVF